MKLNIGDNIRRNRRNMNITQEELSERLGVSFQAVSRWENGITYPDLEIIPDIAAFFNVSVDDLLGVDKLKKEQKINEYLELYDTMKLKDISFTFNQYKKAVKEFPDDFRILIRYMQLLQEEKISNLSNELIISSAYERPSKEIVKIYENIQNHCIDDSIRMWSKKIMITHLMWKYDCISNEEGKYHVYEEYLHQAKEIINTLPSMHDSKEIMSMNTEDYYETHKNALEELVFLLQNELFGYCLDYSPEDRIKQYESLQALLDLIYPDGNFGKNSFHRLYNYGYLGQLYHQIGDDVKALKYLKIAAEYAKELDKSSDTSQRAARFYNYGSIYREANASQFMKIVMTQHYRLTDEFKEKTEFKEIIDLLSE